VRVELHHIIYTLVPYRGYDIRAWSRGADIGSFSEAFKKWFSPYDENTVRLKPHEAKIAVVRTVTGRLYIARVFYGLGYKLDEYKREGVVSHIAEIPVELLKHRIPLTLVETSMARYIAEKGIGLKEVEPIVLDVEPRDVDEDIEFLRQVVDREKARKILEGVSKPTPKVLVLFKRSINDRARLAYGLAKLYEEYGLREYMILTENPIEHILIIFNNVTLVLDKTPPLKPADAWTIVNLKVGEERGTAKDIESVLSKIYDERRHA